MIGVQLVDGGSHLTTNNPIIFSSIMTRFITIINTLVYIEYSLMPQAICLQHRMLYKFIFINVTKMSGFDVEALIRTPKSCRAMTSSCTAL